MLLNIQNDVTDLMSHYQIQLNLKFELYVLSNTSY